MQQLLSASDISRQAAAINAWLLTKVQLYVIKQFSQNSQLPTQCI